MLYLSAGGCKPLPLGNRSVKADLDGFAQRSFWTGFKPDFRFRRRFRPEPYASGPVEASSSPHGPFGVASAPRFVPSDDSCGLFPAPNLPRHGSLECGAMSWLNPRRSSNSRTRVRLPPACRRQVRGDSRSPETDLQGSLKGKRKGLVWLLTQSGYTAVSVFSTL